jgi:hypothetical protein
MSPAEPLSLVLKSTWTGAAAPWVWGHAALLTVLVALLVTKVMLEGAVPAPNRKTLRALNVVIAPLLVVFLAVVLLRFRDLGY